MNSNDFSHLVPKRNSNGRPNLFIRCSDIDFEVEKRKYVEFVCDILVQGRFGPDRVKPVGIDLTELPAPGAESLLDRCSDGELLPGYALSFLGRRRPETTNNQTLLPTLTGWFSAKAVASFYLLIRKQKITPRPPPSFAFAQFSGTQVSIPVATATNKPALTQHDI